MCKGKFNIRQILAMFVSTPRGMKKDIHAQLAETIAERKKILVQWEKILQTGPGVIKKDIHSQLQETIAELKRARQQYGSRLIYTQGNGIAMKTKKAA